jgi:hypothetical protein
MENSMTTPDFDEADSYEAQAREFLDGSRDYESGAISEQIESMAELLELLTPLKGLDFGS